MKFKYTPFCLLLSFFSSTVFSQEANSLLWKIEAPHLSKPSYLYGTMHSKDRRAHEFGDSVLAKLNACDAVALELLVGSMQKNPFALMGLMMMKDTTLDMLLSEEDYNLVLEEVETNMEIFKTMVNKVKPIFTSMMLTEIMMRNDKPITVDEFLEKKGEELGKKLIAIETLEEQMGAIDQIPLQEQARMLMEQIRSEDKNDTLFEKLMEDYRSQDLNAMLEIYKTGEIPEMFDEALVMKRNRVMAHRMDSIMRMQPTFNAVGALHLVGEKGLIALLRERGYQVTPVFSTYSGSKEPEIYFPDPWVTFTSKEGRFTMDFPEEPAKIENQQDKLIYGYNDTKTQTFFLAASGKFTKKQLKNGEGSYDIALERVKQKAELLTREEITYKGVNALDCEFETKFGVNFRYHIVLIKNMMYAVGVGGSPEFVRSAEAEKFFDSLRVN